jgi:uncharacterized protein (DUF362 family)
MDTSTHLAYIDRISTSSYLNIIRKGLTFIHFEQVVSSNTRIFLKPNLTYPTYKPGVMTNPKAIEAAIIALKDYTNHIFIGDSDSGGYNRFSMDRVYLDTGIADLAKRYEVEVVNLSNVPRKEIRFGYKKREFDLALPAMLLEETDFLITMPVPKVHCNTGVSLTFKNQWGCIPEPNDRLKLHPYFKHVVFEVNKAVRTRTAIIDGMYGLTRNGPLDGDAIKLDWMMVASDPGTGARLACELIQIPVEKLDHLQYAKEKQLIPELNDITINTGLKQFILKKFTITREWTDIPGLFAFNSALLAYLAYFSPLSKFFHNLLYLFRKQLYDYEEYSSRK